MLSVMLFALFGGVFLSWIMKSTAAKIKFSGVAVISKTADGDLYLMIRLADPVVSGLAIVEVSGFCILVRRNHSSLEENPREVELRHMGDMSFSAFSNNVYRRVHLMWPTVVAHKIDHTSPLFTLSPEALKNSNIEVIITVTGIRTETGSRILCKTSYLSEEIIWGARFRPVAGLSRSDSLNIGSYGQEDLDTVSLESRTPRQSAESLELESRERCALRIEAWWR